MYCRNCGAEIFPGQNFCRECGTAQEHSTVQTSEKNRKTSYKQKNTIIVITLMTACFFIPMLFFGLLGIFSDEYNTVSIEDYAEESIGEEIIFDITATSSLEEQVQFVETFPIDIQETEPQEESFYIKRSRTIAEKEYDKYLEKEALARFTQKANANNITLDMLNRQPRYYEGKEVYFGGTVLQAIYNKEDSSQVQLRIEDRNTTSTQNVVYVSYTLGENETRILEGDYVDMYGTFDGMITYQSVSNGPITVPHVIGKVIYCYADATGLQDSPATQALEERVDGQFESENGTIFDFDTVEDAEMNYFSGATDYGDCIVAYFIPDMGWDEYTNPPFYRVTAFQNGKLVVFEPNENAAEGVYSIGNGTYSEYTFVEGSDRISTAPSSYSQSSSPSESNGNAAEVKVGYVIESSGGLKIRSGPSTSYEEVGRLAPLESVTIFEIQNNGNRDWGRIDRGWVCMDYIIIGEVPKSSNEASYNKVLDQYRIAQNTNFQNCGQYVGESFSYLSSWGAKWDIYYSHIDLNGDGIAELLIGGKDTSSEYASIEKMDLFTFSNGIPQRLLETGSVGHRAHLYIYPDGTFATSISGGSSTHMTVFYRLYSYSSSASVMHGYGTDMGQPYYYGSDGDPYPISEDEYNALPFASELTEMNINWIRLQ